MVQSFIESLSRVQEKKDPGSSANRITTAPTDVFFPTGSASQPGLP